MAKEFIEREAVLEKQIGVVVYDEGGWDANVRAVPVECIEAIPTADVVEVKWMPIAGYEGRYEVSTLGQVKNQNGIILKQSIKPGTATCYKTVCLSKGGVQKKKYVHRLVAQAFIDNPDNLPMINHKDEDGTNNLVSNLEWCTSAYNANYGTAKERRVRKIRGIPHTAEHKEKIASSVKQHYAVNGSTAKGRREENGKKVVRIGRQGDEQVFDTIADAAKSVGGSYQNISSCCDGKRKTAYGYKWKWLCADGERRDNNAAD